MCQKLPINNFEGIKDTFQFNEDFIKNYNEESDEGYFLEIDIQYLKKLHELHNDLPFLPERMKMEKFEKLVANLHSKTEYVIHIRNFKKALNYGLVLKKIHIDFGKTMENERKHRDIKLVTTGRRMNCLVSEPNYHTRKLFTEDLLAVEMKKDFQDFQY